MNLSTLKNRLTVSVPEAGELLGLGRGAAYAAAKRGDLPTLRIGARLVVPVPKLLDLVGYSLRDLTEEDDGAGVLTLPGDTDLTQSDAA